MSGDLHHVIPEGRPVPRAEARSAPEVDDGFGARAQAATARFGTALVARLKAARERRALVRTVRMAEAQAAASSAAAAPARQKKTGREMRWERRRRRIIFEEVLGWILVPVILFGGYWLTEWLLGFMGTSIGGVIEGVQAILKAG